MIVGNYFVIVFALLAVAFAIIGTACLAWASTDDESRKGSAFLVASIALGGIASLLVSLGTTTWLEGS